MKHRGRHEGSITLRSDGRWQGAIRIRGQRHYVYASTRDGIQKKLRAILLAEDSGQPHASPTRKTIKTFMAEWLAYQKSRVRPNSYKFYRDVVELHIVPAIGAARLTALIPQDVERVLIRAREKKLSPRTIGYIRQVVFMALKKAVQWELVRRNVAEAISAPKRERVHDIHPFTDDELRLFLNAIADHEYRALFLVAVTMGLRKGELLGLKWEDVNFNPPEQIKIRRTMQHGMQLPPKTQSSARDLKIPAHVIPVLRALRKHLLELRIKAGARWHERGYVFTTRIGTLLDQRNVSRWLDRILTRAKIPHRRFHDLRHTCATQLLRHGARIEDVAKMLGHASKLTTAEIYLHAMPDSSSTIAAIMDQIIAHP